MGDATNFVLIFAGELLKRSEHLLTMGLHPSDVIQGYEMALAKGREELESEYDPTRDPVLRYTNVDSPRHLDFRLITPSHRRAACHRRVLRPCRQAARVGAVPRYPRR
jgi:hypothetical protein